MNKVKHKMLMCFDDEYRKEYEFMSKSKREFWLKMREENLSANRISLMNNGALVVQLVFSYIIAKNHLTFYIVLAFNLILILLSYFSHMKFCREFYREYKDTLDL
jgi:hypothetical protein